MNGVTDTAAPHNQSSDHLAEDPNFDPNAAVDFDCPRCGHTVAEAFYGPCTRCRRELRARMAGEQREIEVAGYEPKMNVVPNQIATKE